MKSYVERILNTPSNGELPSGWSVKPLGNIATLQRGNDLPVGKRQPGPYPVIGSNGVVGFHSQFIGVGPGVLVGRSGSVGKVTIVGENYWPLNTALWVKDFHGNDPQFIYYLFCNIDLSFAASGVSVPTLNRNLVHPLPVALPPLHEQKAIAHVLRTVQGAKEATEKVIAATQQLKQSLMKHLFTYGPVPFDQADKVELKETEIGTLPSHWSLNRIGDVTTVVGSGITPRGGQSTYLSNGIPLIRSQNVLMHRLDLSDVAYVSHETHELMSRSSLQPGDVLLNITGASIGRTACVPRNLSIANVNQHVCRMRFTANCIPEFVSYFLASEAGQRQVFGNQHGATRQGLNYAQVRGMWMPVPSLQEQQTIAKLLGIIEGKAEAERKHQKTLETVFDSLLHNLMTGEVRVPVDTDQSTAEAV